MNAPARESRAGAFIRGGRGTGAYGLAQRSFQRRIVSGLNSATMK